jgi:hypothetical protein
LTVFCLLATAITVSAETILSKADADPVFSLNRPAWEAWAERMIHPGDWKVQLSHHDTGIAIMAFAPAIGMGMSIQPMYHDDVEPPSMIIVSSFYPKGSLPPFIRELKAGIESEAQKDLGHKYSILATHVDASAWEGIKVLLTRR